MFRSRLLAAPKSRSCPPTGVGVCPLRFFWIVLFSYRHGRWRLGLNSIEGLLTPLGALGRRATTCRKPLLFDPAQSAWHQEDGGPLLPPLAVSGLVCFSIGLVLMFADQHRLGRSVDQEDGRLPLCAAASRQQKSEVGQSDSSRFRTSCPRLPIIKHPGLRQANAWLIFDEVPSRAGRRTSANLFLWDGPMEPPTPAMENGNPYPRH